MGRDRESIRLHAGVVITESNGRHYVTDTQNGTIHELNKTAWKIVQMIQDGSQRPAIIKKLSQDHPEVPIPELEADVGEAIAHMVESSIIVRTS